MKWLLTLTVSVILLAGCATLGFKDEPAPDTPTFSKGEATAIIKSKVSEDYEKSRRFIGATKNRVLCEASYETLQDTYLLEETYLGDGVWLVERPTWFRQSKQNGVDKWVDLQEIALSWRVYETSKTVEFTGSFLLGSSDSDDYQYSFHHKEPVNSGERETLLFACPQ